MKFKVISFYRYVNVENPEKLMEDIREFCQGREILGRVLIATEGLNGAISGNDDKIKEFKEWIVKNPLFSNLTFREQEVPKNVYCKLIVRVRKEIVALGVDADLKNSGEHISPEKFNEMVESEKNLIILDARNDYEFNVGKFKGAEVLPLKTFREFPKEIDKLKDKKDKKIVMYCTGGVRCEKSSAFLKENGFKDVYQLEGGIINYVNKFPNKHYEGGCYVFDERLVEPVNNPVSCCKICNGETSNMINCHNLDCDKLTVMCQDCQKSMGKNCSEKCKSAPRHRKRKIKEKVFGYVENYYRIPSTALVRIKKGFKKGDNMIIAGKTTEEYLQYVSEMRTDSGEIIGDCNPGEIVTIPVDKRVRKNDKIVLRYEE